MHSLPLYFFALFRQFFRRVAQDPWEICALFLALIFAFSRCDAQASQVNLCIEALLSADATARHSMYRLSITYLHGTV